MKNNKTKLLIAMQLCVIVLLTLFVAASASAQAKHGVSVPPVPENIKVQTGFTAFLVGHGVGTQNYVCRPSGSGFAFVLFSPQATLFRDNDKQLTTHFFSPNPFEANTDPKVVGDRTIRATWEDSRDTSTVWAKVNPGQSSTDPAFVASGAVAWVLLEVVGAQEGPTGGDTLTATKFIQRLNTSGGLAPSRGCASLADVGNQAFVPYTADYFFYKRSE
ncbi:MAG TPA: DUF3455 domain-containing protein [Terriglobia bacterium]|nr:DUF3455 domain-containing protein [Terriglobia bacterium]